MLVPATLAFTLAALLGLLLIRFGRTAADRAGFHDVPDGRLKTHPRPVAVVGGLALLVAVPAALAAAAALVPGIAELFTGRPDRVWAVAVAAVLLAVKGAIDDVVRLRARHKLYGQLVAAAVLVAGDFRIAEVTAFGHSIPLGDLSIPVTMAWFVFAANAFNLLDGMDGMLGVVGLTVLVGLGVMAAVNGSLAALLVSAAAAGGLVGFLRFNLPPATVYMGNSGSVVLGVGVAVLAVEAAPAGNGFGIVPPLALMLLPALDTTAACVRRRLSGRPVAAGDREHLHHVLQRHGFGIPKVLVLVGGCGAVAAAGAVLAAHWKHDAVAVGAAAAVAAYLLGSGLFGATELRLLGHRLQALFRPLAGLERGDVTAFRPPAAERGAPR